MHSACGTRYMPSNISECNQFILTSRFNFSMSSTTQSTISTNVTNLGSDDDQPSLPFAGGGTLQGRMTAETVVYLYVISLLIAFGICGNVISIIVLRQDRERRDTLFLLQALAVADALYLISAIMRYPLKYLVKTQLDGTNRYIEMQPFVFPLLKTSQTIAVWMMVLVTTDRFACVCRPLDAPRWFNTTTRPRYALGVFVAGLVYNLPRYADSCVHHVVNVCFNFGHSLMIYREAFNNKYYYNIYVDVMTNLLVYIIPLVTLVVMTSCLIVAIRQSRRRRRFQDSRTSSSRTWSPSNDVMLLQPHQPQQQQQQQQQQQLQSAASAAISSAATSGDRNATIVLIMIVVVFIVCETPELVHRIITFIERNVGFGLDYVAHGPGMRTLAMAGELLMVVNSSVNFVIYLAFGRRFRRILRETFRFSFRFSSDSTAVTRDSPQGGGGGAGGGGGGGAGGGGGGGVGAGPLLQQLQPAGPHYPVKYPMRFNYAATPGVRQYQRGPPPQAIMLRTVHDNNGVL